VELPGESPRYERSGIGHHHHFRCRSCARVFEIHGCPGDLRELTPEGFRLESHDVTLYGQCARCAVA
jgi:Fur family ferric uptake transcriptional regulator